MKLTQNQQLMKYWIEERERVRRFKEAGSLKPWSSDLIFCTTYFCNIHREDDKVTKWIRENWTYGFCPEYYDFAMIVARLFNLPSTLEAIGQPHVYKDINSGHNPDIEEIDNWIEFAYSMLDWRKNNQHHKRQIWSGAYIVSTNGKKMDKLEYCFYLLRKAVKPHILGECNTLQEAHTELMKIEGLASFLAAQVVADVKNSEGHPLSWAPDWHTFSAPGPGSLRGLSWFWEDDIREKDYRSAIHDARLVLTYAGTEHIKKMCDQDLQNCFCEYDKYMRVKNNTGRSKRKYDGFPL